MDVYLPKLYLEGGDVFVNQANRLLVVVLNGDSKLV